MTTDNDTPGEEPTEHPLDLHRRMMDPSYKPPVSDRDPDSPREIHRRWTR